MTPIRFMFLSSTSPDLASMQVKSGLRSPFDLVNDAIGYYKHSVDAEAARHTLIALNTGNDEFHEIRTDLGLHKETFQILTVTLNQPEQERLAALFGPRNPADIFTRAFYVYDQILDKKSDDVVIAVVDDPANIRKIKILDFARGPRL